MNKNDTEVINFIESKGFRLDIEDMIWYTKDYQQRIVVQEYCKHPYSIFYNGGGFSLKYAKNFKTVEELKTLMEAQTRTR